MAEPGELSYDSRGMRVAPLTELQRYADLMNHHIEKKETRLLDNLLGDIKRKDLNLQEIALTCASKENKPPLRTVIVTSQRDPELIEVMVKHGIHLRSKIGVEEMTVLHLAIIANDKVTLKHLLEHSGVKINDTDKQKKTPLHYAIEGGQHSLSLVKLLLKKNANADKKDADGNAPIHLTMKPLISYPEEKLRLLCKTANVNLEDANGDTALHLLLSKPAFSNLEERFSILLSHGIKMDARNKSGKTAMEIYFESQNGSPEQRRRIEGIYDKHARQKRYSVPTIILPDDHLKQPKRPSLQVMNVTKSPKQPRRKSSTLQVIVNKFDTIRRRLSTASIVSADSALTDLSDDDAEYKHFPDESERIRIAREFGRRFSPGQSSTGSATSDGDSCDDCSERDETDWDQSEKGENYNATSEPENQDLYTNKRERSKLSTATLIDQSAWHHQDQGDLTITIKDQDVPDQNTKQTLYSKKSTCTLLGFTSHAEAISRLIDSRQQVGEAVTAGADDTKDCVSSGVALTESQNILSPEPQSQENLSIPHFSLNPADELTDSEQSTSARMESSFTFFGSYPDELGPEVGSQRRSPDGEDSPGDRRVDSAHQIANADELFNIIRLNEEHCLEKLKEIDKDSVKLAKNAFGFTMLHTCAQKGYAEVCDLLIQYGVDVDAKDNMGRTTLHIASEQNCANVIQRLLDLGADGNIRNAESETPLSTAIRLHNLHAVKALLADRRVTSFHLEQHLFTSLSERKQDVTQAITTTIKKRLKKRDHDVHHILPLAAKNEHWEVLEYLLSKKQRWSCFFFLDKRDESGFSAAHYCAMYNQLKMIKELYANGASLLRNVRNNRKGQDRVRCVRSIAEDRGHTQIVDFISSKYSKQESVTPKANDG